MDNRICNSNTDSSEGSESNVSESSQLGKGKGTDFVSGPGISAVAERNGDGAFAVDEEEEEMLSAGEVSENDTEPLPSADLAMSSTSTEPKTQPKKRKRDSEERMKFILANMTEDQLDRFEKYRRSSFSKAAIRRIMQTITGNAVGADVIIAMAGIAKVFVGQVVEEAVEVKQSSEESGPIQPKHLREAVRRLRPQGKIPRSNTYRPNPFPL